MNRLLVCGFGSFPAAPQNPSAAVVEAISAQGWTPPGTILDSLTLPVSWTGSVEAILAQTSAAAYGGVLVVGVAVEADAFRVETLGRNRADVTRVDHDGGVWPQTAILAGAPETVGATAPVDAMLQALLASGLPARFSDDAGDYLCNFTLFQLVRQAAAPAVGFLHVPQVVEFADGASFTLAQVDQAVRASLTAFAGALSSPVRRPAA